MPHPDYQGLVYQDCIFAPNADTLKGANDAFSQARRKTWHNLVYRLCGTIQVGGENTRSRSYTLRKNAELAFDD